MAFCRGSLDAEVRRQGLGRLSLSLDQFPLPPKLRLRRHPGTSTGPVRPHQLPICDGGSHRKAAAVKARGWGIWAGARAPRGLCKKYKNEGQRKINQHLAMSFGNSGLQAKGTRLWISVCRCPVHTHDALRGHCEGGSSSSGAETAGPAPGEQGSSRLSTLAPSPTLPAGFAISPLLEGHRTAIQHMSMYLERALGRPAARRRRGRARL